MLLNPYRERPVTFPGTRLLQESYETMGVQLLDLDDHRRIWTVTGLYLPLPSRALGGIRARLEDQKGFVTFCNQRDFEVLLGISKPGAHCSWSGGLYCDDTDSEWMGFCCDADDLVDDLFERECLWRASVPGGVLYPPLDIVRRVHLHHGTDLEDRFVFVSDVDPDTGFYPDTRLETVERRWARSERNRLKWERS